jgi:hypothetical protein
MYHEHSLANPAMSHAQHFRFALYGMKVQLHQTNACKNRFQPQHRDKLALE